MNSLLFVKKFWELDQEYNLDQSGNRLSAETDPMEKLLNEYVAERIKRLREINETQTKVIEGYRKASGISFTTDGAKDEH